jgi:hypothetical protein
MLIDNPKFELGTKNEVEKGIAMIYCDIDGQGKQWYEVKVVKKDVLKSEEYFEMKMCDEEFLENAGGIVSGMSGTPIVQNGKIIGAISKTDKKDPTVFYGIYIDNMVKAQEETHERKIIDTHITIKKGSFAESRHARDILWPANFFLLSIIPSKTRYAQIDEQGAKTFHEGDVLHIRYATFDEEHTKAQLTAIVGEQEYDETKECLE